MPPPPGLFSITIGWPRWRDAISESLRRCVSVDPPAGHGTMSVTGREGYASAAAAGNAHANARTAKAVRNLIGIASVSFGLDLGDGDDLRPLGDLVVEELGGLRRRAADGLDSELVEARADVRGADHFRGLGGELRHHVA